MMYSSCDSMSNSVQPDNNMQLDCQKIAPLLTSLISSQTDLSLAYNLHEDTNLSQGHMLVDNHQSSHGLDELVRVPDRKCPNIASDSGKWSGYGDSSQFSQIANQVANMYSKIKYDGDRASSSLGSDEMTPHDDTNLKHTENNANNVDPGKPVYHGLNHSTESSKFVNGHKREEESSSLLVHNKDLGDVPYSAIYECPVCKQEYLTKLELSEHVENDHPDQFELFNALKIKCTFKCAMCTYHTDKRKALMGHSRIHTGYKPYECKTCGKRFAQSSNMTIHARIHTGEKPYKCKECDQSFSRSDKLLIHERKHSGTKPYKCELCHKAFFQKHHMINHVKIHNGKKQYKCLSCNKAFTTTEDLKMHESSHWL